MAPHCDTLDGPVVKAAKRALEEGNVNLILPWVSEEGEEEVQNAFEKAREVRVLSGEAREFAEYWFFETVVRVHRAGEGAPYTGLKPAGLDWGPVVPRAEKAIEGEDPHELIEFMTHALSQAIEERLARAVVAKRYDENDVASGRRYVQAELGLVLWAHHVYKMITGEGEHGEEGEGHNHKE